MFHAIALIFNISQKI